MVPTYTVKPHHRLLAEKLEAVEAGAIKRLMVFMPPRHGKSQLVSVPFPAWYLGRNPSKRIIGCSYAARLAERFSGQARNQIEDARYPFPARVAHDSSAKALWGIAGHEGGYVAAGVGGPITGFGGDLIVIDDPVKNREEADSETRREAVWDWYQSTLYTRLEQDAAVVLVMTRWHEDDLAGKLLTEAEDGGEQWDVVSIPAIAEADDPLGRAPGDPLWPERFPLARLERTRIAIGSRNWHALYQQRPTAEEGAMFKRAWFNGSLVDSAPDGLKWVRYWDLAVSTKTSADFTASCEVAVDAEANVWIRDIIRGRWEWPDAKKRMKQSMLASPDTTHYIEEAIHGLAALQELRRDPDLIRVPLRGVKVDRDKVSRSQSWSARAEAGKVRIVKGPNVSEFLSEVCSFPQGAHDDMVDSVSGAIEAITGKPKWGIVA